MGLFSSSKSSSSSYAYDQRSLASEEGISAANNAGTLFRWDTGDKVFAPVSGLPAWKVAAIAGGLWILTRPKVKAAVRKAFKWKT
jgi:hypothetical protein